MISVSQAIPDFGKAIAAAVAATLQEVQQEQTKNTQTSEYKFDASAWNDPKYYPAYAAKEEGDAE